MWRERRSRRRACAGRSSACIANSHKQITSGGRILRLFACAVVAGLRLESAPPAEAWQAALVRPMRGCSRRKQSGTPLITTTA
jgi:hypothetical protein